MRSLVLFNNKSGVGKTTLTFHLAHMAARLGLRTVALDYDPQSNLSAVLMGDEALLETWERPESEARTVASCVDLVRRGVGVVREPALTLIDHNLWLLPGHLALSRFEQTLAEESGRIFASDNERALLVTTALATLAKHAANAAPGGADLVLVDVGPSLGVLNRAALLPCDAVVIPLAPDLFSLQGLQNVGPTLRTWRRDWEVARDRASRANVALPDHRFLPAGYIVQQHLARVDRLPTGHERWAAQIPSVYKECVLDEADAAADLNHDPACIALVKHFASLVPLAQQARKPMFDLKQADGIGGGQIQSVAQCRTAFAAMVRELAKRLDIAISPRA
jgi:chromosome partitioning protein